VCACTRVLVSPNLCIHVRTLLYIHTPTTTSRTPPPPKYPRVRAKMVLFHWFVCFSAALVQWPPRSSCAPKVLRSHPTAGVWTRKNTSIIPKRLNSLLSSSTTAPELLELHEQHGPVFDRIHLATCWSRLGRVDAADRKWLQANDGARLLALREQTSAQAQTFDARCVSTTAHALAKLAIPGTAWRSIWEELEGVGVARRRSFNPQGLSNTAWAFATAGQAAPALFDAIAEEGAWRVCDFSPQILANTAWAFTTAGHAAPALFDAIAAESAGRVREFKPQELCNTVWAFAKAGHAAPALFDAIAAEAETRIGEFPTQTLATTAWAFASAGHAAPTLFDAIAKEASGRVCEFNNQDLSNVAWAFAAADCLPESSLFDQRFARRCEELAHEFPIQGLSQLHQWRLWYESERTSSDGLPGTALLARCAAAFREAEAQSSRLQRQVAQTLVSLGASVQEEVVLEEGYSLDVVVDWHGERLAIEVDGPSHFLGREPTCATALKRRQLEHFGWRLISVPYWKWDELDHPEQKTAQRQQTAYLSALLSERCV